MVAKGPGKRSDVTERADIQTYTRRLSSVDEDAKAFLGLKFTNFGLSLLGSSEHLRIFRSVCVYMWG